MRTGLSRYPRIDKAHARRLKIVCIPRHDREAMYERSGRDEAIAIRPRIWHMQSSASLGNRSVNRQNMAGEGGQNMPIHPGAEENVR